MIEEIHFIFNKANRSIEEKLESKEIKNRRGHVREDQDKIDFIYPTMGKFQPHISPKKKK